MIYNAFSPNGDGNNDLWRPLNIQDYPNAVLRIYNRWGNMVFQQTNGTTLLDYSWNGYYNGQLYIDQYVWTISLPGCPTNTSAFEGEGVTTGTLYIVL
jgi:gliding motility-associated-like protein